ncbi:MAG: SRPBCC family protein [Burkholderiales bacterium]|nr:SRPBCC family protein [Burkholderiales bacterium]
MLKKVAIGLAVVIVVLLGVIATRPDTFRLERSTQIAAPAEVVFANVNAFNRWAAWSPWEKLDLNMKKEYSGPASGAGAMYAWNGNDDVGSGKMTIVDSKPSERIDIKLEFLTPFEATNDTLFTFAPEETGTKVTWVMEGKNNFMAKAMHMVMDMDAMVGADFEKGLASMKALSEYQAQELAKNAAIAANFAAAQAATIATMPAPELKNP